MRIEHNKENNTISIGNHVMTGYVKFRNDRDWANYVMKANGLPHRVNSNGRNLKADNKAVQEALCCSRPLLYKTFNKLQHKVFVAPIYDIIKKIGFRKHGFNEHVIKGIYKHKDKLEEVYNDKLYNLLPAVYLTGKSPQELKKANKQAWKIISSNSLNKNKALTRLQEDFGLNLEAIMFERALAEIPTTLLEYDFSTTALIYLKNNFKGSWSKHREMSEEANIFMDAILLSRQLGETVNPAWSPRRLKEEHDRMSKDVTAKRYPKTMFPSVRNIYAKTVVHQGYVATLLDSPWAIAEEGNEMGHCVAGYSSRVADGLYLVYSITKDGERSSTIGINRSKMNAPFGMFKEINHTYWTLQQQYGKYNKRVTDAHEIELAELVVTCLNERLTEESK